MSLHPLSAGRGRYPNSRPGSPARRCNLPRSTASPPRRSHLLSVHPDRARSTSRYLCSRSGRLPRRPYRRLYPDAPATRRQCRRLPSPREPTPPPERGGPAVRRERQYRILSALYAQPCFDHHDENAPFRLTRWYLQAGLRPHPNPPACKLRSCRVPEHHRVPPDKGFVKGMMGL
ncbi:hypothetical protein DSECCO2_543760 [anaerobic digester metagenome]